MEITDNKKTEAAKLMKKNNINSVFINSKGEFFTNENRAELSEKGKKENVVKLRLSELSQHISDEEKLDSIEKEI